MKKYALVPVLFMLVTNAFALDLSAGFAMSLDFSSLVMKGASSGSPFEIRQSTNPLAFKAFLDATYLQISIGFLGVINGSFSETAGGSTSTGFLMGTLGYVALSADVKYPFVVGSFEIFPLAGAEYRLNLSYTNGAGIDFKGGLTPQQQSDLSELWLRAGVGADYIVRNFYIRSEVTVGFKPLSASDNAALANMQAAGISSPSIRYFTVTFNMLFGWYLRGAKASNLR